MRERDFKRPSAVCWGLESVLAKALRCELTRNVALS